MSQLPFPSPTGLGQGDFSPAQLQQTMAQSDMASEHQNQPISTSALVKELEAIKRVSSKTGVKYWTARELQSRLGYDTWENFHSVVKRAMESCKESGVPVGQHFRETTKMVPLGSGASRSVDQGTGHQISTQRPYAIACICQGVIRRQSGQRHIERSSRRCPATCARSTG